MTRYQPVIGLETHVQLSTRSKLFCGCSTDYSGQEPNSFVCAVCLGLPGVLPVLNAEALKISVRTVLAVNGTVSEDSRFDRKQYFYPDLPKAYQISQFEHPIGLGGHIDVELDGAVRRIEITRLHMEEDAGKLVHVEDGGHSLVDYNRCSVPLLEIVTEPDIRSPEEARLYLQKLKSILEYLGASDCNMEEGSLRCDANVSLMPAGSSLYGSKAEIKNMNSFKAVSRAIQYEIERQAELLDRGEKVVQETRLWDDSSGRTSSMRSKEDAHDYRYFPEPDLPPVRVEAREIEQAWQDLPELPDARRQRLINDHGLSGYDAGVLTAQKAIADYFEAALQVQPNSKSLSNWIQSELLGYLNRDGLDIEDSPVSPGSLGELIQLIDSGKISGKIAKEVFAGMYQTRRPPAEIVREKGLEQISDESALEAVVASVLEAHPEQIESYRGGKTKVIGFLVGQVMKETRGQANPGLVNQLLKKKLGSGGA